MTLGLIKEWPGGLCELCVVSCFVEDLLLLSGEELRAVGFFYWMSVVLNEWLLLWHPGVTESHASDCATGRFSCQLPI